jgi:hypothetical protein
MARVESDEDKLRRYLAMAERERLHDDTTAEGESVEGSALMGIGFGLLLIVRQLDYIREAIDHRRDHREE